MKDSLLSIYRAVAEGRLAQAEALVRIKALKRQASDAGQGVVLATPEWFAASATSAPAQPVDRLFVWGVDPAVVASLKASRGDAQIEAFAPPANVTSIDGIFADAALQGLAAIQSMLASARSVRALVIVADTRDADTGIADEAVACGFDAMFRTAMEETPALVARVIRVPADIGAAELQQIVHDESRADAPRGAAVRHVRDAGGLRREVLRWRVLGEHVEGQAQSAAPVAFREGGCYLITGGAGGIGLQFVREILAQCRSARIVLAGRSTLAPDARRMLDALATPLHRIEYVALDVTDRSAVDALVARLREHDRPLRGIVHCAGIIRDGFILRKSPTTFASVLAPKVAGLANLDLATRELPLDFILLCSSFAACWGIVGQVDYAAANAFMDEFAAHRNRLAARGERHGRTLSVNWPLWQDGGMSMDAATRERLLDHTGMRPLSTVAAMRAMYRGLALSCARVLVMEGRLPAMRTLLEATNSATDSATDSAARIASETARDSATAQVVDATPVGMDDTLRERALDYLCQQFSQVLKIPAARLRPQAPLEQYGIDSILAMKLVTHLETIFGRLPKTLAFEYQTIAQLNDYFCSAHADRLISLLSPRAVPADTATAPFATIAAATAARSHVPGKRIGTARRTSDAIQPQPHAEAQPVASAPRSDADMRGADAAAAMARIDKPSIDDEPTLGPSLHSESIAIVGISGRYPDAWDLDEYWRNLSQGVNCIREIPADRWRWQDYYRDPVGGEALAAGLHSSRWGGFIQGADEFDPRFFSITPRDAEQIDPQERLFLQHAWMAIEDAGYTRAALQACRGGQVGVYAGVMYGEYNRSGSLASIANRVSYAFNLHGPSMTLDTMCSSSLTAIHLACQDLKLGRTDMALAGGVNLSLHPGKYGMLSAGQFISSAGHCQSFGEGGDGYIPGEGVGVVVLKRLSDAQRDGDAIHAVIRGSALNHGGKTNGYTVPNPQAQAAVISAALKDAGVDARHISYIEAHGTGTKLGDPIEIAALGKAFREHTADTGFCLIGSAKSNIGHCESAAGIAGLTKVILQMRHRQIAPSLHSQRLNPNIDFGTTPFEVNQRLRPWNAPVIDGREAPLIAGISSFGAGGGNAHLIVEAHTGVSRAARDESAVSTTPCAVLLSARTLPQLRQKAVALKAFVEADADIDLHGLACTLQLGREAMEERLAMRVGSRAELIDKLAAFLDDDNPEDGALADDLYYAQSRRHRESIALFTVDRDLQASVDGWFVAGKVSRLLDVWTKGLDLDWSKLHGAPLPGRMHLPVYPFARERYRREESTDAHAAATTAQAIHSLVHRNASKPGQQRYLSLFRADDPRIVGLRFQGQAIVPRGLQLEAARAALADGLGMLEEGMLEQGRAWALRDVRFGAPRAMPATIEVEIAVLPPGQGRRPEPQTAAFELSAPADGHVFCQGFVEACADAPAPMPDIAARSRGVSTMFPDRAAMIEAQRANGFETDALYAIVTAVQRSADGLWATFEASGPSQTAFADCTIDPPAVDAAMLAAQWLGFAHDVPHLPAGFAQMRVHRVRGRPRYAWIRAHATPRRDGAPCVDISLYTDDGAACIEFTALTLLPAVAAAAADAEPAPERTLQATPAVRMLDRRFESRASHHDNASHADVDVAAASFAAALHKPGAIALEPPALIAAIAATTLDKPSLPLSTQGGAYMGHRDGQALGDGTSSASVLMRDRGDGIFALRLHAPAGALEPALIDALRQALAHAAALPSLKALLIESDERIFLRDSQAALDREATHSLLQALAAFPAPTLALLRGQALGAGFRFACACDGVIAVDDQDYGFSTPEQGPTLVDAAQREWLAARFGEPLASLLAIQEQPLSGRELQAAGWGAVVVSRSDFDATVDAYCASLSDKSADALRLLKAHLASEFDAGLAADAGVRNAAASIDDAAPQAADFDSATAHDAVALTRDDDNFLHLRLKADASTPTDVLLRQLQQSLRAADGAAAVVLHSDFDGFLPEDASAHDEALRDALRELSRLRAPVVAVLDKSAIDAGLLLALACDAAVYSEDGEYGAIALHAHCGHLELLDALLARNFGAWGRTWALSGERFSGRALRQRLPLLQVCAADSATEFARQLAGRLHAQPRDFSGSPPSLVARLLRDASHSADPAAVDASPATAAEAGALHLDSTVVHASVDADGVVLVRLEDRDARNMFSDALIAGLQEVFERIGASPAYKAVVLTGYGTYFSSGGTRDGLKAIQEGRVRFTDQDVFHLPMRCPLPVFAAMQGHGIGAGWTLGLFCDGALFSEESRYLSPYMNFGFTPGAGATAILPARLGFDLARDSLFTGREIDGEALARRNRLLNVLPRERVVDAALALARSAARHARADLVAWKAACVARHLDAWKALFAREVAMHETTLVGHADALRRIEQRFAPSQAEAEAPVDAAPHRASAVKGADILPVIRRLLAEELRADEAEIDAATPFVDLGLDSISSVTWIGRINAHFGLAIEATKVYRYPNLRSLARHIGEHDPTDAQAGQSEDAAIASTAVAPPTNAQTAKPQRAISASAASAGSAPPSIPVSASAAGVDLGAVRRTLIELLAQELRQPSDSIDADRGFVELGLDSISGVTWVRAINQRYDIAIEATRVYTYPTVEQFARLVRDTLAQRVAAHTSASSGTPQFAQSAADTAFIAPSAWPALASWRSADTVTVVAAPPASGMHATEIAVIGMAGRFPMAKDVDSFWDNIASGRNCVSEIPSSRWDTRDYYVEGQPGLGQSNSKWMGVLEGHDRFDPLFFGLSPVEAEAMDPQQRLFLQCCWHGMENAGYTAERLSGSRCGVFAGCAHGDYNLLSREQQINALGFTGGATSILAARVSYFMNLQGPCVSIDTACSSSLVAIASACDSLITGAADIALAGGVYVMANADMFLKTAQAGMLSPEGRCYTFDQRANGFVPGEGVGVVMLKRLADAERDGDSILGVVRGWGVNQDGRTNGITAPNAESQQRLIRDVYDRFGIDPGRIELVEAHGTGTKLGDPIEVDGLKSAFRTATDRRQYCAIGSVKTNIGHCLTAAGVSGFIKLLLALKHRTLPPSANFETPNEHLDLDASPFFVNTSARDWASPDGAARHAAISSFGFSGTNAHLVLAEHVPSAARGSAVAVEPPMLPDAGFIVPLSARSSEQLLRKAADLRDVLRAGSARDPGYDPAALAYSLQCHRDAMDERLSFVARSVQDVIDQLGVYIDAAGSNRPLPHGFFAAHVRQGRESVRLLNEDAGMAALVVDKCIAEGNALKLCELWVKGLALDWRRLHGARTPPMVALPPYPFAEDVYWIAPDDSVAVAMPGHAGEKFRHPHPLLQEQVADLGAQGYRQAAHADNADAGSARRTERIHLPTYAFARMHCWLPSEDKVRAAAAPATAAPPFGQYLHNLDVIAGLFAELEEDTMSPAEVAARVKQLA
ncbi:MULTISPECIES: SDR family NAD(P)-dependent oxidoreductase [unclassified Lysobacter]|uniref:SDR family NAD(P)-dependent oxidoreductase n=1 Tax=unclassified Lysobacter TaxID=2635362 RepID=UPI001BE85175|nr:MULTISPECIES: SDR family NAD(P)-dependent oxidoreductase [unclassified Lysobacter]MBT2744870.1 SDR family NAD(P)-dependent oxidoreductase [Lysobacter sp. ISL-42]MBT2752137.1 SDR family NAD(P)-dependent oxidoreductase [Lysobacter sp. ISL-50]MBT2778634.1 SDR family NAD(P)-dependent oxidoreductase [Lysobacter sp. ISL-54]MBT2780435.1 SDR family NAD(P)-dependent oxidoreductase [Lysobacter sp. ISL-52]